MIDWSEATLRWLCDHAAHGILTTDAELNIRGWNHWLEAHTGKQVGDVIGCNLLEIYPELMEKGLEPIFRTVLEGHSHVLPQNEYHHLLPMASSQDPDSALMAQSVRIAPLWDDEQVLGTITTIREGTERVQAEEALQAYARRQEEIAEKRTQQLHHAQEQLMRKEKLANLGQLAGGVGHELRNPLSVITNAVYYLRMVLSDADETTQEYLEMIASEVRNATKIITNLLGFARMGPSDRQSTAVSLLTSQALLKCPPPASIEVLVFIAPDLPTVFVDPLQIEIVLMNLITNAYQAMPDGGKLTISAKTSQGTIALSVTDTGVGISAANMERLFEPLFTTKTRGLGLGLTISKNLMEANGGGLEVETVEGAGCTFRVSLPISKAPHDQW